MSLSYIKVEFGEFIESKRNILSAEMNLLKAVKQFEEYRNLRKIEFAKKESLRKKLKELDLSIKDIQIFLPKEETAKISKEISEDRKSKNMKIEDELKEIKEKLRMLG